jgi:hypothetical protein
MKYVLACAALLLIMSMSIFVISITKPAGLMLYNASATFYEAHKTVLKIDTYATKELARLDDPRNSKAIDAAIQTAAVFNGTGRLINKEIIPDLRDGLKALAESAKGLTATELSLKAFVEHTDASLNDKEIGLMVQLAKTIEKSGVAIDRLEAELDEASKGVELSLQDIHDILSDPDIKQTLNEILLTAKNSDSMMGHADKSMGYVEYYLSPKKAKFWARVISLFIPKLNIQMN